MNKTQIEYTPLRLTLAICLTLTATYPVIAYAYVDPGSGSVIVTTVLGLVAAVGYTFRKYYYKIKRKLKGGKENSANQKEKDSDA